MSTSSFAVLAVRSLLVVLALPLAGCASELPGATIAFAGVGSTSGTEAAPAPRNERAASAARAPEVASREVGTRFFAPRLQDVATCRRCSTR